MQCKPIKSIPPGIKKKNGRASCWLAQSYGLTGGRWPFQIRHGVGDWPFHWPGWSIRLSRSGLHGRSLVSYGNIDYHLGRSRSGGCQPQAVICALVPLQSRECPPHLAHGPINRRRRSSGDVARELVDRFPTRQDKADITLLRTNILVVLVTSIWRGCHSVAGIRAKTRTWISYAMQPYLSIYSSLFLYSSCLWHMFCRLWLCLFWQLDLQMVQCLWGSAGVLALTDRAPPIWKPCAGTEGPCCCGWFLCCDSPFLFLVTFIFFLIFFLVYFQDFERKNVLQSRVMCCDDEAGVTVSA